MMEGGVGGGDSGTERRVTGRIHVVVLGLNAWAVFTDLLVDLLVDRPGDRRRSSGRLAQAARASRMLLK
jgi:hypothetical protein